MSTQRDAAFVSQKWKESQERTIAAKVYRMCEEFDNRPLEECMSMFEDVIDLKQLEVKKGKLQVKGHERVVVEEDDERGLSILAFDDVHWSGEVALLNQEKYMSASGLVWVYVRNNYTSDRTFHEEGWHETKIDGEILLVAADDPQHFLVWEAKGSMYVDIRSIGGARSNTVDERILMTLNGSPFWEDFDLRDDDTERDDYDYDFKGSGAIQGHKTEEERVQVLMEAIEATFPGVSFSKEDANKLLLDVSGFFAPDNRPHEYA